MNQRELVFTIMKRWTR